VDAHLFRSTASDALDGPKLADYLERYAVGFAVVSGDFGILDSRPDLLEPVQAVDKHRIYRTRREPSYFLRGNGRIEHQSLNRVSVADVSGDEVVLRFHWMETLGCRPACRVERVAVPGDRVGFVRIASPPRRFEIFNGY